MKTTDRTEVRAYCTRCRHSWPVPAGTAVSFLLRHTLTCPDPKRTYSRPVLTNYGQLSRKTLGGSGPKAENHPFQTMRRP